MAYLYAPEYVTEVSVKIDVKLSGGGTRCETVVFKSERDGKELTNQFADTVLSATHLAIAGRSSTNGDSSRG